MTDFGRRVALHKTTHQDSGVDEIDVTALIGRTNYVDRGDPSSYDWLLADLITDNVWYDLDLSSIIPEGTTLVHFHLSFRDDQASSSFALKKKGNLYNVNVSETYTQVSGISFLKELFIACDSNLLVQYRATNTTFNFIGLLIRGWFV